MRPTRFIVAALVVPAAALISASSLSAQKRTNATFNGAWRVVSLHVVRPDSTFDIPATQGLRVMFNGYYSQTRMTPPAPGVQQAGITTAEQKVALYDQLTANAGTYVATDSTLTIRFQFAKDPTAIGRVPTPLPYRLRGDTLWQIQTAPWQKDSTKTVTFTTKFIRQK